MNIFFPNNEEKKLPTHHQKLLLAMVRSINPDFQHASPESPTELHGHLPLTRAMSTSSLGHASEDFNVPPMPTLDLAILDNKDEDKLAQDAFLSVPCLNFPNHFSSFCLTTAANYR